MSENSSTANLFTNVTGSEPAAPVAPASEDAPAPTISELDMLKQRATVMGIKFSNNIGVDALKAKIQAKLDGEKDTTDADGQPTAPAADGAVSPASGEAAKPEEQTKSSSPKSLRQQMVEEQMKLVRLRITNLDPRKKDLPGEIFTVANKFLGTVRKYIPYGEVTDNGYHVPYCIYQALKEREFLDIRTRKRGRGDTPIVESRMVREFALEVLPPLTPEELERLAAAQAAAGNS